MNRQKRENNLSFAYSKHKTTFSTHISPLNNYTLTDWIKTITFNSYLAEELYKNPLLSKYSKSEKFNNKLNNDCKEVIKQATETFIYKEILFRFFIKNDTFTKLEILIKPHYYFNNNKHNANDFTAIDCIKTLTEIKETFNLPTNEMPILNIEFGLNGVCKTDCKDLITYSIFHDKNEFINSSDTLRFSKISFKHHKSGKANKYKQIKFYVKGLQFPQYSDINTFRFEVKSKERKYIKTLGIYNYEDLLNIEIYHKLGNILKDEFSKVLILDIDNDKQNLTPKESLRLDKYLNTFKWIKAIQGSRNLFQRYKKDYFNLISKTDNNIHQETFNIIDKKINMLLKVCAISTPKKNNKKCAVSIPIKIRKCVQFQTYI